MPIPADLATTPRFSIDGITFEIDNRPPPRRPSTDGHFTLVKTREFIEAYAALAETYRPRTILELGIFEGGSFVLLDKLFRPDRLAALDLRATPVAPLVAYCAQQEHRTAHWGVSQDDRAALGRIVDEDLGGTLDMVVDDASHAYAPTRAAFTALFPRLSPGGLYVVEDWAWSHWASYQGEGAPRAEEPALTNLLFETVAALGSGAGGIGEVRVLPGLFIVRKVAERGDPFAGTRLRGRSLPQL